MKLSLSEIRSNAMEFAAEWRDAESERAEALFDLRQQLAAPIIDTPKKKRRKTEDLGLSFLSRTHSRTSPFVLALAGEMDERSGWVGSICGKGLPLIPTLPNWHPFSSPAIPPDPGRKSCQTRRGDQESCRTRGLSPLLLTC